MYIDNGFGALFGSDLLPASDPVECQSPGNIGLPAPAAVDECRTQNIVEGCTFDMPRRGLGSSEDIGAVACVLAYRLAGILPANTPATYSLDHSSTPRSKPELAPFYWCTSRVLYGRCRDIRPSGRFSATGSVGVSVPKNSVPADASLSCATAEGFGTTFGRLNVDDHLCDLQVCSLPVSGNLTSHFQVIEYNPKISVLFKGPGYMSQCSFSRIYHIRELTSRLLT